MHFHIDLIELERKAMNRGRGLVISLQNLFSVVGATIRRAYIWIDSSKLAEKQGKERTNPIKSF